MTYPHTEKDNENTQHNKSNLSLWKQNKKGQCLPIRKKPNRKHDTYCYNNNSVFLIWYEEFEDNFN